MKIPDFEKIIKFDTAFLKRIGSIAVIQHLKGMSKGIGPDGKKFKALSRRYANAKRKQGAKPIPDYRLSGTLQKDFNYLGGDNLDSGEFVVEIGIEMSKATTYPDRDLNTASVINFLHHGSRDRNIPPRPLYSDKAVLYEGAKKSIVEEIASSIAYNIQKELGGVTVHVINM